jgi:hypothetical protein
VPAKLFFCCGEVRANAGGQFAGEPPDLRRAL